MFTIRSRLLWAFLGVITALLLASLFFLGLSFFVTEQYRSISDTMIAEYELVDNAATLIDAYNRRVQSAGTESTADREQARIDEAERRIAELLAILDAQQFDTRSTSDYLGFKASIEKFTEHIDDSLVRFEQSSITNYFDDFNEANKQYGFVRENGTTALFSQLRYSASVRESIERTYQASIFSGLAGLVVLLLGCALFVFQFSKRLAAPLHTLTVAAEKIAAGDTTVRIDTNLAGSTEIRSLALSFDTMVRRLLENIQKVDASNKELAESSKALETQNDELGKLNKLMVGRELRMVELKKEIEELRAKIPGANPT